MREVNPLVSQQKRVQKILKIDDTWLKDFLDLMNKNFAK